MTHDSGLACRFIVISHFRRKKKEGGGGGTRISIVYLALEEMSFPHKYLLGSTDTF